MTARAAGLLLAALLVSACAPNAPEGVDKAALDQAVGNAVGDPGTCVLIAEGGKTVYRYGSNVVCGRKLPACGGGLAQTPADLLEAVLASKTPMTASCPSNPQGSRLVAWASGPVEGHDMVYAAVMEGDQVPPGVVIADKLGAAFKAAGL